MNTLIDIEEARRIRLNLEDISDYLSAIQGVLSGLAFLIIGALLYWIAMNYKGVISGA